MVIGVHCLVTLKPNAIDSYFIPIVESVSLPTHHPYPFILETELQFPCRAGDLIQTNESRAQARPRSHVTIEKGVLPALGLLC